MKPLGHIGRICRYSGKALEFVRKHHRTYAASDDKTKKEKVSPDATRVPELWLIPPDGKPRPVGLLRADQTVTLTLPADLAALARKDTVLAVSLEPPGGSTTVLPTGPVIATGKLTSL